MKTKKKHDSSSEDSEDSHASVESISSSDSESDPSSILERRQKKKRKRANSSESDTDSAIIHKRAKKRKHKKKKKKHSKKKRHVDSDDSASEDDASSASDGEVSSKRKRKHKHKQKYSKKAHSSASEKEYSDQERNDCRLQSVVKEKRSSDNESQPPRTYYQKEFRRSPSVMEYRTHNEVERFYRGSSKDRSRGQYHEQHYSRINEDRYRSQQHQQKYDGSHNRYEQPFAAPSNIYNQRRPREYEEFNRQPRFENRGPAQDREFQRKPRQEEYPHNQGYTRYNPPVADRGNMRMREQDESRNFRPRPGPPEPERVRDKAFMEKREKYNEVPYTSNRSADVRRPRPPVPEKQPDFPAHRESNSPPRSKEPKRRPPDPKFKPDEQYGDRSRPARVDARDRRPIEAKEERPRDPAPRSPVARRSSNGRKSPNARRSPNVRRSPAPRRVPSERPRESRRANDGKRERERSGSRPRDKRTRFSDTNEKNYSWGKTSVKEEAKDPGDKEGPNFGLSGKLTADANTVNGVVIKYTEPDDAKQPKRRWRFYPFKGDKALSILYIHRQSCFVLGRDKKVVDIHLEHPSVSKQHAALQYRATPFARADGSQGRRVRPYIIDLDSANGTFVNNKKVDARRYVELLERDVVKFGFSQREYVLLHENSKDDAQDDDQIDPGPAVTTTDQIKLEKRSKMVAAEDGD